MLAECPCGLKKQFSEGRGLLTGPIDLWAAYCINCKGLVEVDRSAKPVTCRSCGSREVHTYDKPESPGPLGLAELQDSRQSQPRAAPRALLEALRRVFAPNAEVSRDREAGSLEPPRAAPLNRYECPVCRKAEMRFVPWGSWD